MMLVQMSLKNCCLNVPFKVLFSNAVVTEAENYSKGKKVIPFNLGFWGMTVAYLSEM